MIEGWLRDKVWSRLEGLSRGELALTDGGVSRVFGSPGDPALRAEVRVTSPRFYRRIALGGALGAAEAFMDGDWTTDDPTSVIRVFARNLGVADEMERRAWKPAQWVAGAAHRLRRNTRDGSRRNISSHYDLGEEFFGLFLDDTMTYSCGVFPSEESGLREASIEKYDRLCRKLELSSGDRVLEIGCGWGGFASHAAKEYGCRVTATTISARQYEYSRRRIEAEGLSDLVEIVRRDYRDLEGSYDKLVSIEMIEAIGYEYFDTYFRTCSDRLRPGGLMALQAITIPDRYFDAYRRSVDFIQKYIFPGGCLTSTAAMTRSVSRATDMEPHHLETMPDHYERTLRLWREGLTARWDEARGQGLDERFLRCWLYYLSYCEAGFAERQIGVAQLLLAKPESRRTAIVPRLSSRSRSRSDAHEVV